jgi:thiamine pyrophosphate-dependent acetolactate synthase large subunit-like protein
MATNGELQNQSVSSAVEQATELTAADVLVDMLLSRRGLRHIVGYSGGGINGVIEALRRRRSEIQFIQVRHEAV